MSEVFVPSTWARLTARGIDQLVSGIFYIPFAKSFIALFFTDTDVVISVFQVIIFFFIPAIYEGVFLALMQKTPGKWFMGLKVVPASSADVPLSGVQCILRPLVGQLSFFFGWAIYALAFFRYDRTHLADWVAETRVVQFVPRRTRTKRRWILGWFLILVYGYESLSSASHILNQIDWQGGQLNLRQVIDPQEFMPEDMDI